MNQTFKNILVVQDAYRDSVEALEWAAKLVPPNGHVKILDVQPPITELWQEMFSIEYEETPVYHRKKSLSELARGVEFPNRDVTGQVRSGTPVAQIVREVLAGNYDLVIKEAYAKMTDFVFGSLDMRLLRYCPIPVWLAQPESNRHQCRRILVALNPEASEREMALNERLIRQASAIALGFNCKLSVVGAFQSHETVFPILDQDSLKRIEGYTKTAKRHARENLDSIIAKSVKEIDSANVILEEGPPDEVILNAVNTIKPELLVMGSVARHGISGMLIGNAAERVLRQVKCSVLTVKPSNFVSPIEPDNPREKVDFPKFNLAY